jgi:hypothetical protein
VPDLLLTFPASATYVAPVRAAVSGYAARFVDPAALAGVTLAVGEAAGELVDGAGDGAALVVEVRRTPYELVVRLAREGPATTGRRGLGYRLLHALADNVDRSTRPNGAEIVLGFRVAPVETGPSGPDLATQR